MRTDLPQAEGHEPRVPSGFWLLALGLILGALLRAWALPLPGTGDMSIWKIWSFAATYDLLGVYGVGGTPPERRLLHWQGDVQTVNYPPVALAELAVVGRVYRWSHPLFEDSPALNVAVKLPGVVAEVVLAGVLLTWGRRAFGRAIADRTALGFWLNPAVVLTGSILGYIDSQAAVPAVLALVFAWKGTGWLAGAMIAIAVLTKPQALFVGPVIAATLASRDRRLRSALRALGGAALVTAAVVVPYVLHGAWANLTQALGRLATHDMLSGNATNAWWIFTWVLRVLDVAGEWGWPAAMTQEVRILGISRAIALGYPNARVVGTILVICACGWAAWRIWSVPSSLATTSAAAGWSVFAYAMLAAQVHENHLYFAVPFLAVAAGLDGRYRAMLWWVTAILTLNLLLFEGLGRGLPRPLSRRWTGIDASVLLAMVALGVFGWMTKRLASGPGPRAAGGGAGATGLPLEA